MKIHIVVKLRQQLPDDGALPDWQTFINDKSVIRESLNGDFDRLMRELNLKFWVTREYKPSEAEWTAEEISQGLNRTYRIIFQQDCVLPENFIGRVAAIPTVEEVRQLEIGEAKLPQPQLATQTSIERQRVQDLIYLS
jgi:thermitase